MTRFFALIVPREGNSLQEFHDHWRHPHGTLGGEMPSPLRSYVQAHQIDTELLGDSQHQYPGVAISLFDSVEEGVGYGTDPAYTVHVQPDEAAWSDPSGLVWLYTDEEVIASRVKTAEGAQYADALWNELDRAVTVQLLQFVRPAGPAAWAQDDDVELGRRIGALRHVRNHPSVQAHGDTPPFIGARQLWWPTLTDFNRGVARDRAAFDELIARGGPDAITMLIQSERYVR